MPRAPLVLALLLVLPAASAAWRAPGAVEPDTLLDAARMWRDAPEGGVDRVYFHGFAALEGTSLNPNVATLGSRVWTPGAAHHRAILGVWRDCNGDGYMGLAEGGLQDYRSALLLDTLACPAQPGSATPVHNDGEWVSELLTIGMVDPCEHATDDVRDAACPGIDAYAPNERVHYADGTGVWADLGLPGAPPVPECVLAPFPRGTTSGTGAMVGYADCQSARGLANAVNAADPDGALGLRFEDASRPEDSSSLLNQRLPVTPFAAPGSAGLLQRDARRSATLWDCSRAPVADAQLPPEAREVVLADPTGLLAADTFPFVIPHALTGVGFEDEDANDGTPGVLRVPVASGDGSLARVPATAPSLDDPTASSWATLSHALDGTTGDCDPATRHALDDAWPGGLVESGAAPILESRKDRTSFSFLFYDGHRGLHPGIDPTLGRGAPSDGGLFYLDHDRTGDGPLWSATAPAQQDPQLLDRRTLAPAGALHVTYYAHVGPAALARGLALPAGTTPAKYGSEACGSFTSGVHGGWVCDPALWWRDAFGASARPAYAQGDVTYGRVVGDPYHLRDVDCYDGSPAAGSGLQLSLVPLSATAPCPEVL